MAEVIKRLKRIRQQVQSQIRELENEGGLVSPQLYNAHRDLEILIGDLEKQEDDNGGSETG